MNNIICNTTYRGFFDDNRWSTIPVSLGDVVTTEKGTLSIFDGHEWQDLGDCDCTIHYTGSQPVKYACNHCGTKYSGKTYYDTDDGFTPHCPNCGALMIEQ